MRELSFSCLLCLGIAANAQNAAQPVPIIASGGYSYPLPLPVAPGQLITLFVQNVDPQLATPLQASGRSLPAALVSVTYHQGTDHSAAILDQQSMSSCLGAPPPPEGTCNTIMAVTVQMPFEMLTLCPLCGRPDIPASLAVTFNGVTGPLISVQPFADQVRILTGCDVMVAGSQPRINTTQLPCAPLVTHANGKLVSATSPARGGEELVAYAVGLGQTNPPQTDGEPATAAAPTVTTFAIDFNYRSNVLAAKPTGPSLNGQPPAFAKPDFTGATVGFVGLYQINFKVPHPPAGLVPCADTTTLPPFANAVQSNLTVSVGSAFSFDGAGICVQPAG